MNGLQVGWDIYVLVLLGIWVKPEWQELLGHKYFLCFPWATVSTCVTRWKWSGSPAHGQAVSPTEPSLVAWAWICNIQWVHTLNKEHKLWCSFCWKYANLQLRNSSTWRISCSSHLKFVLTRTYKVDGMNFWLKSPRVREVNSLPNTP